MADTPRHPRPDLTTAPDQNLTQPENMGFFELLRRLETDDLRFGRLGGPAQEPARLGQRARLAMATRDVAGFRPGTAKRPAEVDVEVLGLFGPEGAMPLHLTRAVMARLSDRWFAGTDHHETADTTFLDFANMLQHRMLSLYWRAWADARPEVQTEHGHGGHVAAMVDALAGIGLPGSGGDPAHGLDALKRRHATALGHAVQGPERLTRLLLDVIGAPVRLREFVGQWLTLPQALQTRLGRAHAGLATGAVAGARSFQRQTRAELVVGPLDLQGYVRLIDDRDLRQRIRHAVRFAADPAITFDLRPVLARASIPDPRLGQVRLGRTLWISPHRRRDATDLCLPDIAAAQPRTAGVAA